MLHSENNRTYIQLFLCILVIGLIGACSENNDVSVQNPDLVFPQSLQIKVPEYEYGGDDDRIYYIKGDTGYITGIPDTMSNRPQFMWNDTLNSSILTLAVFSMPIKMEQNNIQNTKDIIWQWHTGDQMKGEIGKVLFSQGKPVENENILYDKQPLPLESGLYYWAIWGWTKSGTKILQSSRPLSFYVP